VYCRDPRRYHWVSKSFATESLLPYVVYKRANSGNLSADSHSDHLGPSVNSLLVEKRCLLTQSLFLVSCWPWSSFTHVLMLNSYLHMMNGGIRSVVAMVWSPPYANDFLDPIDSPWDGVMHQELAQWGYTESERSQLCDYGTFWGLGRAFGSLGIDPRSNFNHGPNRCFRVSHGDTTRKRPDGRSWPLSEQTYISPDGRSNRASLPLFSFPSSY
jgi:hypothetical protein